MNPEKAQQLCEIEGFSDDLELAEACTFDSIGPGICTNEGCEYTTDVEADCENGFCEECETHTVSGGLILLGMI